MNLLLTLASTMVIANPAITVGAPPRPHELAVAPIVKRKRAGSGRLTEEDVARLEAAQVKRDRRAAKRVKGLH